jgi:spore maturation protein SpmA
MFAAFNGRMEEITYVSFQSAKDAVNLAISLIGIMALWLGFIKVLEIGGLMRSLAIIIKPTMSRLFPDIPSGHPAMSAMLLNISANILGLGNAATPFGVKAMLELNKLNPFKGVATNSMILFLVINTSAVTVFPLGVISLRAVAGADRPADIFLPTLIATICSTICGVFIALLCAKIDKSYINNFKTIKLTKACDVNDNKLTISNHKFFKKDVSLLNKVSAYFFIFFLFFASIISLYNSKQISTYVIEEFMSFWLMPWLFMGIICYGIRQEVLIYEAITSGAKQGFYIAIKIIPFLVAIMVAISMFRASGAMDFLIAILSPITNIIGMPADTLPMAIMRPLSGQGSFGIMSLLLKVDPNSYSSFVASVMQGSTETTFYILAVYFGSIGIHKIRHALFSALCADFVGIIISCLISSLFWNI